MSASSTTKWLLDQSHSGFCNITLEHKVASCDFGTMGAMGLWKNRNRKRTLEEAAALCLQKCAHCHRCRYISVSASLHDCSWYHKCDMAHLNDPASPEFKTGPAISPSAGASRTLGRQFPARPLELGPTEAANSSRLQRLAASLDEGICLSPDGIPIGDEHTAATLATIEEALLRGRVKWPPHRLLRSAAQQRPAEMADRAC